MPPLATVVARNIRAERSRRLWKQADLAERLGWSQSSVSAVEIGQRAINLSELPAICRALDVTMADLVRGADEEDLRALGL